MNTMLFTLTYDLRLYRIHYLTQGHIISIRSIRRLSFIEALCGYVLISPFFSKALGYLRSFKD